MKFILLLICVAFVSNSIAQNGETFYKSKSGKLVYQFEVDGVASEYILIFDNYGKKQAMEFVIVADGVKERVRTIVTETEMYMVNYNEKTVIKFPVDANTGASGMETEGFNVSNITEDVLQDASKRTGTETINGKPCDVYTITDGVSRGKYWVWNNFLMKADYKDENNVHGYVELKEIKTDMTVAASEFQPPAGFPVTDMTETMQQMKMMQDMYGVPDEE